MPFIEVFRTSTLINCKCQILYWSLWNEKTDEWHINTKVELWKVNFGGICKN